MNIKLVLARTEDDNVSVAWTATKTIEVELPLDRQDGWQIIGAEWPQETIDPKRICPEKKAPEAVESCQGARKLDQVQDNTKPKENQIPDEILRELAAMQKRFRELYSKYKLCGVGGSEGVHITSDAFIETFKDYEISDFNHANYIEKLKTTAHGVGFFCIR